jgi:hypothetical protein
MNHRVGAIGQYKDAQKTSSGQQQARGSGCNAGLIRRSFVARRFTFSGPGVTEFDRQNPLGMRRCKSKERRDTYDRTQHLLLPLRVLHERAVSILEGG